MRVQLILGSCENKESFGMLRNYYSKKKDGGLRSEILKKGNELNLEASKWKFLKKQFRI
jgi:hypothetical protein